MWPFSLKKKIPVPQPPSEDLLRFPKPPPLEKEIPLEKIKKKTTSRELPPPPQAPFGLSFPSSPELPSPFEPGPKPIPSLSRPKVKPAFLRVQHYQQILENLDRIKNQVDSLEGLAQSLEKSEFNEDKYYEMLKSSLRKLHERLLFLDDLTFKKS